VGIRMVLHSKTALVTGASRGIGRAQRWHLLRGCTYMLHYGRSAQEAQSLVESIHCKGGRADAIRQTSGTPEEQPYWQRKSIIVGKQLEVLVLTLVSKAATIKDHT